MTVGSLFSGIGGLDLGFERAGFTIRWQCEIDPFCRSILKKHWPDISCYEDVRTIDPEPVDILIGGFPCQNISSAGKREGLHGEKSSLWFSYLRLIDHLRPRYAVVENTRDLASRGLGTILGGVAEIGYNAEWDVVPAENCGAPHRRPRTVIVAYANRDGLGRQQTPRVYAERESGDHLDGRRLYPPTRRVEAWAGDRMPQPLVHRVADGIPGRVDRVKALGNAVVPQWAEWIARSIAAYCGDYPQGEQQEGAYCGARHRHGGRSKEGHPAAGRVASADTILSSR